MAKKWEIYDLNGNRRIEEEDDDDVLKPNRILRVPMMFRDGMSEMQKSVVDEKMRRHAAQRFVLNDALDLHKPGQRFSTDRAAIDARERAYQDAKRELQDAWRQPVADVRGDVCTVREGGVDEGSPGHLRMVNGELRCVPDRQDARPTCDAATGQRIKDAAYREMVDELQNAWRTPIAAPKSIEPRAITDAPLTMTADAAQRIKDEAWLQSVKDLESAWKGPAR